MNSALTSYFRLYGCPHIYIRTLDPFNPNNVDDGLSLTEEEFFFLLPLTEEISNDKEENKVN